MLLDLVDAAKSSRRYLKSRTPKMDSSWKPWTLIERRMGLGAIRFGHSGSAARWRPSGAFRSPHYTTRWADIPVVKT